MSRGYRAILATSWYLDEWAPSKRTWKHFYQVNDLNLEAALENYPKLALGGVSCLWGELINPDARHM